jgi:hypothetical protein
MRKRVVRALTGHLRYPQDNANAQFPPVTVAGSENAQRQRVFSITTTIPRCVQLRPPTFLVLDSIDNVCRHPIMLVRYPLANADQRHLGNQRPLGIIFRRQLHGTTNSHTQVTSRLYLRAAGPRMLCWRGCLFIANGDSRQEDRPVGCPTW